MTIVDLFGGSGLLSHIAKRVKPDAAVIYNDFDNYQRRIVNITRTNALLERIREVTDGLPADKTIPVEVKARIIELIADEERTGFVDCVTLSSSLLFSMKYVNSIAWMNYLRKHFTIGYVRVITMQMGTSTG